MAEVTAAPPAIIGTGFAVPPQVRGKDDPLYKDLDPSIFNGYDVRRVLGPGETLTWLMVEAAQAALISADVSPDEVDVLLGFGSVAEYITPNTLAEVHHELALRPTVPVIPINDDYTNFNTGVVIADALIRTGSARTALIVCGDNWTQHVNYSTPQSASAGDGAGAAVVAAATHARQWTLVDREQLTVSANYGAMYMAADHVDGAWTAPWFHITREGFKDFKTFGEDTAPEVVQTLITRNHLSDSPVTVIAHQTSLSLYQAWEARLGPTVTFLSTLTEYANVVLAAIPLTLAAVGSQITTDHLILFGLGAQMQAGALLLSRWDPQPSAAATSSALASAPQSR